MPHAHLSRIRTEDFLTRIESLSFPHLRKALHGKRTLFPEEFAALLARRYFHTAIEYQSLDRTQEQTLLTEKGAFAAVIGLVR